MRRVLIKWLSWLKLHFRETAINYSPLFVSSPVQMLIYVCLYVLFFYLCLSNVLVYFSLLYLSLDLCLSDVFICAPVQLDLCVPYCYIVVCAWLITLFIQPLCSLFFRLSKLEGFVCSSVWQNCLLCYICCRFLFDHFLSVYVRSVRLFFCPVAPLCDPFLSLCLS